jgi:uncharacterized protein YcfJ
VVATRKRGLAPGLIGDRRSARERAREAERADEEIRTQHDRNRGSANEVYDDVTYVYDDVTEAARMNPPHHRRFDSSDVQLVC